MTLMKLYYAEVLNPRKACAVARHLDLPVEYVRVALERGEHKSPEFLALNPNGKLPVLETGDGTLWESTAIMCRLARVAGSDLWPSDDRQANVVRWLAWDAFEFMRHPGQLYFEHVIRPMFGAGEADAEKVAAAIEGFRRTGAILDGHLAERDWLVGDAPTIADFGIGAVFAYADAARIPLDGFPAIAAWVDRLDGLRGWRDPFPEGAGA